MLYKPFRVDTLFGDWVVVRKRVKHLKGNDSDFCIGCKYFGPPCNCETDIQNHICIPEYSKMYKHNLNLIYHPYDVKEV